MKLKHVFFITFLCVSLNIMSSSPQTIKEATRSISSDMPPLIDLYNESSTVEKVSSPFNAIDNNASTSSLFGGWFSQKQSSTDVTPSTLSTKTSNTATDVWFGFEKIMGKSETTIFHEKYDNGTVEGDLVNNPTAAFNDFNNAMNQRVNRKNLMLTENQRKTAILLLAAEKLSQKTKVILELTPAQASNFKKPMKANIETITTQHATIDQPQLEAERTADINRINCNYKAKIQNLLDLGKPAASNYNKVHAMSKEEDVFDKTKDMHYEDTNTYEAYLRLHANPTMSAQEIIKAKLLQSRKNINEDIARHRDIDSQMARILRDQQTNNSATNNINEIIHEKHFQSNSSYLKLLSIVDKQYKELESSTASTIAKKKTTNN
jgi:hypothetical protein